MNTSSKFQQALSALGYNLFTADNGFGATIHTELEGGCLLYQQQILSGITEHSRLGAKVNDMRPEHWFVVLTDPNEYQALGHPDIQTTELGVAQLLSLIYGLRGETMPSQFPYTKMEKVDIDEFQGVVSVQYDQESGFGVTTGATRTATFTAKDVELLEHLLFSDDYRS